MCLSFSPINLQLLPHSSKSLEKVGDTFPLPYIYIIVQFSGNKGSTGQLMNFFFFCNRMDEVRDNQTIKMLRKFCTLIKDNELLLSP